MFVYRAVALSVGCHPEATTSIWRSALPKGVNSSGEETEVVVPTV